MRRYWIQKYMKGEYMKMCGVFSVLLVFSICSTGGPALKVQIPVTSEACSSFCLDNNGYAVFGTNYDHYKVYEGLIFVNKRNVLKKGWNTSTTDEYAVWISEYGSVTFNLVGYQFVWGGMNEAGLVISTMNLSYATQTPYPDERPPLSSGFWMQYLLDTCSTVEEVIARDSQVRISNGGDHYLVCDRTGECAVIEFIDGFLVCHTGDTMPVKALTNHTYRESVRAWQESDIYPITNTSLRRFSIAADRVKAFNLHDQESAIDYAFDTLEQVSGENMGRSNTFWSIVFDTENYCIYFRTKMNPHIRYIEVPQLDFSCTIPVMMLDINEDLSGNITTDFKEYSYTTNRVHMTQFFEKWGIDISSENIRMMCQHFDAFSCLKRPHYEEDSRISDTLPSTGYTPGDTHTGNVELACLFSIIVISCMSFFIYRSKRELTPYNK